MLVGTESENSNEPQEVAWGGVTLPHNCLAGYSRQLLCHRHSLRPSYRKAAVGRDPNIVVTARGSLTTRPVSGTPATMKIDI